MTIHEIKASVEKLGNSWEQYKAVQDRIQSDTRGKGSADALDELQCSRIDTKMNEYAERIARLEASIRRPAYADNKDIVAVGDAEVAHKEAFRNYLRKGIEGNLLNLQTKSLSASSDPDGGFLIDRHLSGNIIKTVFETSPMRKLASVELISSDTLEIIEDKDQAAAGWTTESAPVTDTSTPQFGKKSIQVHELYAQPKATQKLIDDASLNIEEWLATKIADIFGRMENTAFINGDGVGRPRGILTYPAGTGWGQVEQIGSGIAGGVSADSMLLLFYSLKEPYAARASFLMNRATIEAVRKLKDDAGHYLWNPGLALGSPDTLLGVPVHQAADMPIPAANSLAMIVGDFRHAYQIVDRIGMRILRDPFTDKPFVKFYATKRVGGDVVNFEAIKVMKLA